MTPNYTSIIDTLNQIKSETKEIPNNEGQKLVIMESINKTINEISKLNRNTIYTPIFIDANAFIEALENSSNSIESVEILDSGDNKKLLIYYSRYSMNPVGYHIGYENVIFSTPLIEKQSLHLYGIPYKLSRYVVNANISAFTIENKSLPLEEHPEIEHHTNDCGVHNDEGYDWYTDPYPETCTCGLNESWEGYIHPDDEFFYSDLECIIDMAINNTGIPNAKFDPEEREWTIGNTAHYKLP